MLPHDTVTLALPPIRVVRPGGLSAKDLRVISARRRLQEASIAAH
jgi:hypothetical protein